MQSKPETQSTTAGTIETISSLLNAKSPHTIAVGQMRVVLFGKSFGERGIGNVINNLQRDPNIGRDVQLALVDGSTEELLKHVKTNGSLYLSELLEQNIKNETIPRTALHIFYITSIHLDAIHFFLTFKYQKTNLLPLKGSHF